MNDFTPLPSLIGGALIGLAASLFLLTYGRVAGVSGLYGSVLRPGARDRALGFWFIAGLVVAGALAQLVLPGAFATAWSASLPLVLVAGLLVGFGTRLGNGCTSGHGVCGVARLSPRSLVATGTFVATGMVTVFIVRHVIGGAR
jgi:uncharacterized membrane protein YedE/YeeE